MIPPRIPSFLWPRVLHRATLVGVCLVASLALASASPVQAASYQIFSTGRCDYSSFQSRGDSTLSWAGYFLLSGGRSDGELYRFDSGGNSTLVNRQTATASGVNATATAYTAFGGAYTSWQQLGKHTSSFFIGEQWSYSSNWTC